MYNYKKEMMNDVINAINDFTFSEFDSKEEFEEKMNDELWVYDSVTGNASGSYTFNRIKAREYVLDNIDLLGEMIQEFDISAEEVGKHFIKEDWEWFDVSIRCYLLSSAIHEVLEEIDDNEFGSKEEETEEE